MAQTLHAETSTAQLNTTCKTIYVRRRVQLRGKHLQVRLVAVAWWPHGQLTADLETHLNVRQVRSELRKLGWIPYGQEADNKAAGNYEQSQQPSVLQFNFSGNLWRGFIYDEKGFDVAVRQATKHLHAQMLRDGRAENIPA